MPIYYLYEKSEISYIFDKTLVLSIICNKCDSNDEKEIFYKKVN